MKDIYVYAENNTTSQFLKKEYENGNMDFKELPIAVQIKILREKGLSDDLIIEKLETVGKIRSKR